jgi:acyl-CoA thioester hydrolase
MTIQKRQFDYHHVVVTEDIDELGHAGNFHYVKWMQRAAVAHSSALGWPMERYDALGAGWVVRSHRITYLKPAFEGDDVVITTWVADMKSATSLRQYRIRNAGGELLADAETNWAFIDYGRQRPIRIPTEVRAGFADAICDTTSETK